MAAPTRAHPEALAGVERREKVRTAIQRLLENDQFLDLIVGELEAVGAL